ncbi:MAG: hypothetical protein L6R28_21820 [Planctomycetes bacterium]|nr:hypothetical protein [Planctomycetota bacterium]
MTDQLDGPEAFEAPPPPRPAVRDRHARVAAAVHFAAIATLLGALYLYGRASDTEDTVITAAVYAFVAGLVMWFWSMWCAVRSLLAKEDADLAWVVLSLVLAEAPMMGLLLLK